MTKVAIFASGSGSNFENIVQRVKEGQLQNLEVTALYTDYDDAYAIERAQQLGAVSYTHLTLPTTPYV